MTLAPYVRILGRGPGRSRSLTQDEAFEAMQIILSGTADKEAIGALLMLLRMKGETAAEIAGFASAVRNSLPDLSQPALDWPSYAAGRSRGLPWFLLAAKLVAGAGHGIVLHGWNSHQMGHSSVRDALASLSIPQISELEQMDSALADTGICYIPLETLSPRLLELLRLRDVLGLRSCINTVLRVMNPAGAGASVQGVFHPSYRDLQADAGLLLGQTSLSIIKGGGGEFERHPGKPSVAFGLRRGKSWEHEFAPLTSDTSRLADGPTDPNLLSAVWNGEQQDDFGEQIVLATAALALDTLGEPKSLETAKLLWSDRDRAIAA